MALLPQDITGLVLAGGRGSRMGGVDKGLQPYRQHTLAEQALQRLAPQVGPLMINANRNLDTYRALGVAVWPDSTPDYAGPLAGMLTGLEHCSTPWLVTVPCDTPQFPLDLVSRLAEAAHGDQAEVVMPTILEAGRHWPQPVFCLLHRSVLDSLRDFLASGRRKIDQWTATRRTTLLPFDDPGAFLNVNTLDELQRLP